MKPKIYDFGGYVTRYNLECGDGRTIRPGAFSDMDGVKVPLVWNHGHSDIGNVLGHTILENRKDGVYGYCSFNNTDAGLIGKKVVEHDDVVALSIYANKLKQKSANVTHGKIREVSLVLAGSNPGALIDNLAFQHGDDGEYVTDATEAFIFHGEESAMDMYQSEAEEILESKIVESKAIEHVEKETKMAESDKEKTVQDVFDEFTDEQKNVVYAIVGAAVENVDEEIDEELEQSEIGGIMSRNVFAHAAETADFESGTLSHSDTQAIFTDMRRVGSLKEALLQHGIESVEFLFPEARTVTPTPVSITREMDWVAEVLNDIHKSPFSRIKSTAANLTADEARAKGYIKGHEKKDQAITSLKRITTPQTIYKKQTLERDDVLDITDFDVVAYIQSEMRVMLNEELARAILIGDGRDVSSPDKINAINIRPIWKDDEVYTVNKVIEMPAAATDADKALEFIDEAIRQRKNYKGTGKPKCYIGTDLLTACRLLKDTNGYRLYKNDSDLADDLRVSKIVEVGLFDDQKHTVDTKVRSLGALITNLRDYTVGADKGGEINNFDDFDIDFNQQKYLIETRASGALVVPMAALSIEFATA